jgi:phage gp29-like protein
MKWQIIPVGNSQRDREIFHFVQSIFLGFENFHQDIRELMDALSKGFAVSEILYKLDNGLIKPVKLLSRDQTHFAFDTEGQLRWITKKGGDNHKGELLPQNKFLIHRHNPRAENPYGSSILGPRVFWASWYKLNLIKYWVQYCERFAQPMPIGTFPKHWSAQQQKQFLDAISRMYSHKSIVCEEGTEVNLFETKGTGIDVLKQATAYLDHQISLAILGQSSTTSDDQLGSYAKSKVAKEISDDIIESDAIELASTMNKYIKIWVDLNFKNVYQYPSFIFQNQEKKDLQALSQVYKTLTEMGIEIDKDHIAKIFDLSITT